MNLYTSIPVVENFFSITYLRNKGAAFGIFAESGFRLPFLILASVAAVIGIIAVLRKLQPDENLTAVGADTHTVRSHGQPHGPGAARRGWWISGRSLVRTPLAQFQHRRLRNLRRGVSPGGRYACRKRRLYAQKQE